VSLGIKSPALVELISRAAEASGVSVLKPT
jgi:hypothetical protein